MRDITVSLKIVYKLKAYKRNLENECINLVIPQTWGNTKIQKKLDNDITFSMGNLSDVREMVFLKAVDSWLHDTATPNFHVPVIIRLAYVNSSFTLWPLLPENYF